MKKIYELIGSYGENCSFIEDYSDNEESVMIRSMKQEWKQFINYTPIKLELSKNESGRKNYKFDFSSSLSPFFIFSDLAKELLYEVLYSRGQFLDVITESKNKKFIGYYPTNVFSKGILDLEKSEYVECDNVLIIDKIVLIKSKIPDDYLFTIEEDISRVFVTEQFKELVEQYNLIGFEFSEYNEVSLS